MDFDLSEEQRAIQDTAREFARGEMMPFARDWDENEIFPVDTLREAAALGFAAIYVRDDVGRSALTRSARLTTNSSRGSARWLRRIAPGSDSRRDLR